jgi:hypothetical protein
MAKAYKYQGILGKPMKSVPLPLEDESFNPFDEEYRAGMLARSMAQREALIDALFADCGIDRNDVFGWMHVALKLAERHVNAFQREAPVGRKPGSLTTDDKLMVEMQTLINSGKTISNAAEICAKRRGAPKRCKAIETHYHRTLKDWKHADDLLTRWLQNYKKSSVAKSRG